MYWAHQEIREKALQYIEKASMDPETWEYTKLGVLQKPINELVELDHEEMPLVSCYFSHASWFVFTTSRILGNYYGKKLNEVAYNLTESNFGNFKGYGQRRIEVMTLRFGDSVERRLEYETGKPSIAPIYATRYWKIKFPVLARKYGLTESLEK